MKQNILKISAVLLSGFLCFSLFACAESKSNEPQTTEPVISEKYGDAHILQLSESSALLDGAEAEEFDYTWHCDPSAVHDEVKNAPAEYYTGTKPETDAAAYIDSELFYFPQLPEDGFRLVNYDGEQEWAYYYTDGVNDDFIFATLPRLGSSLPTQMMHSAEEAAENRVLHIAKAGTYVLRGTWKGQIWVDLGDKDETFADEEAKVTLILDGAEISCSVAPGIVCYSAFECDNGWEERETYSPIENTENAGVTIVLADGSENTVNGTNVFRMLKTVYKDEDSANEIKTQKKLRKTDGALYSYVSMNLCGEEEESGSLTVNAGFEGIDSELHLSVNGGNITVNSQDDGMNVNEDHVSTVCFNGGTVTIHAAQGAEGDGVDSNGFVVLNGGTLNIDGITAPDSALDSEDGITYHGSTVILDGVEQTYEIGSTFRETGGQAEGGFPGGKEGFTGADFDLADFKQKVAALDDDATLEDVLALLGMNRGGAAPEPPQDGQFPDGQPPEPPQDGQRPDGMQEEPPEKPDGQPADKP